MKNIKTFELFGFGKKDKDDRISYGNFYAIKNGNKYDIFMIKNRYGQKINTPRPLEKTSKKCHIEIGENGVLTLKYDLYDSHSLHKKSIIIKSVKDGLKEIETFDEYEKEMSKARIHQYIPKQEPDDFLSWFGKTYL